MLTISFGLLSTLCILISLSYYSPFIDVNNNVDCL